MKKPSFILVLGLALGGGFLSAAAVSAQETGAHHQRRLERKLEHLERRLDLTEDQISLIRPVLEEARDRRRELRSLPRDERRSAARTLRDRVHHQLEGILTPDQLTELESMRRRHRGRMNPERMIERMREHLNLTDDQVTRIRPILERAATERRSLRDLERPERREAARTLRTETMDAVRGELTEAQQVEFDAFRETMRHRRAMRHRR